MTIWTKEKWSDFKEFINQRSFTGERLTRVLSVRTVRISSNLIHTSQIVVEVILGEFILTLVGQVSVLSLQDCLSGLVKFKLGDDAVRGVDAYKNSGFVGLLTNATLYVNNVFLSVNLNNFPLTSAVLRAEFTPDHHHLIILSDRHRAHLSNKIAIS